MPKLTVTQDTVFKPGPLQSSQYSPDEIVTVQKGRTFDVHSYAQDKDGHIRVALLNTKLGPEGKNTWVVFGRHVEIDGVTPTTVPFRLNVPFYSQRDNSVQSWRTCNSSVHAMFAEFIKPGCIKGSDDFYWKNYVNPRGDTIVHSVHTDALRSLGIQSEWRVNLDYSDIDRQLERGYPVPIAVLHRGTLAAPTGGHIILVIGKQSEDEYVCHDPWGEGFGSQYEANPYGGEGVVYPKSSLNRRWLHAGPGSGWGRIMA